MQKPSNLADTYDVGYFIDFCNYFRNSIKVVVLFITEAIYTRV